MFPWYISQSERKNERVKLCVDTGTLAAKYFDISDTFSLCLKNFRQCPVFYYTIIYISISDYFVQILAFRNHEFCYKT